MCGGCPLTKRRAEFERAVKRRWEEWFGVEHEWVFEKQLNLLLTIVKVKDATKVNLPIWIDGLRMIYENERYRFDRIEDQMRLQT